MRFDRGVNGFAKQGDLARRFHRALPLHMRAHVGKGRQRGHLAQLGHLLSLEIIFAALRLGSQFGVDFGKSFERFQKVRLEE